MTDTASSISSTTISTEGSVTDAVCVELGLAEGEGQTAGKAAGWRAAFQRSRANPYTAACAVYLVYAVLMLLIDIASVHDTPMWPSLDAGFGLLALLHLVNGLQYLFAWHAVGFSICGFTTFAEHFNIAAALLYLASASLYAAASAHPATEWSIAWIELVAAYAELVASFLWVAVWHAHRPTSTTNSSKSLFYDTDAWALALTVVPSIGYCCYNTSVLGLLLAGGPLQPPRHGSPGHLSAALSALSSPLVYVWSDVLFAAGAVLYLYTWAREDGWLESNGGGGQGAGAGTGPGDAEAQPAAAAVARLNADAVTEVTPLRAVEDAGCARYVTLGSPSPPFDAAT